MSRFYVLAVFLCLSLLTACTASRDMVMPNMPDGQGTFTFVSPYSGENYYEYTGQWAANLPKGQGRMKSLLKDLSCSGEFGTEAYRIPHRYPNTIFAKGDVFEDGMRVYSGQFVNQLGEVSVCSATGVGTVFGRGVAGTSWNITGTFLNTMFMYPGPCKIEMSDGKSFSGDCTAPPYSDNSAMEGTFTIAYTGSTASTADVFKIAKGLGVFIDSQGDRYEGYFKAGAVMDGIHRVTRKGQVQTVALFDNGRLVAEQPAPEIIAAQGKRCGKNPWLLLKGSCAAGKWDGSVEAYTADGRVRLQVEMDKGVPVGEAVLSSLVEKHILQGTLKAPVTEEVSFIKGRVKNGETVVYTGEMAGLLPSGKGICRHEGSAEACEYVDGERVDALHKIRLENRKIAAELDEKIQAADRRAEQRAQASASEAAAQAAARQQHSSDEGGFQWGKLAALGAGAGIGGIGKLSSADQLKGVVGMVKDSMSGQDGISNLQAATSTPTAGSGTGKTTAGTAGQGSNKGGVSKEAFDNGELACQQEADRIGRPYKDSQLDPFCVLATSNLCVKNKFNYSGYDAERQESCIRLKQTATSFNINQDLCSACR